VYALLLGVLVVLTVLLAGALATSIRDFVDNVPTIRTQLPEILAPWQQRLQGFGLGQVNLVDQATIFLANLNRYAEELAGPLQQVAVGALGALGNLVFVLVLSLYMVIDRDRIVSFLFRIVPPGFKDQARLLETSVASAFGGFLRGQALMGLIYGLVAVLTSAALNLEYLAVTSALSGFLMAIPFFGPFVSWAPPVLVAVLVSPDATVPAFVAMMVGWFLVMNVLQPRLMEEAVGIHPIVVLGSVLVGSKIAGITGAIFGIPIAAVLSAFFFYYLGQSRESGPVAARAARRLEAREGRQVRVPREPDPGVDPDVDDSTDTTPVARPTPADRPAPGGG
jgi:predicted PurR-regulated permease PerM